jgi:hypothetical protein
MKSDVIIAAIYGDELIQFGGQALTANIVTNVGVWRYRDVHRQHVRAI